MIEHSMQPIQSISRDVNSNIIGISKGTNSILESFAGINDLSTQSGKQITDLANRINIT